MGQFAQSGQISAHPEECKWDEAVPQQMLDKCVLQLHCLCPEVVKYEVTKHILKGKKQLERTGGG